MSTSLADLPNLCRMQHPLPSGKTHHHPRKKDLGLAVLPRSYQCNLWVLPLILLINSCDDPKCVLLPGSKLQPEALRRPVSL